MRFGEIEVEILQAGTFWLDGGAMFGVVPKPLWERVAPADELNRIRLAMNVLLIRAGGRAILVEAGGGAKRGSERRPIFGFSQDHPLAGGLGAESHSGTHI